MSFYRQPKRGSGFSIEFTGRNSITRPVTELSGITDRVSGGELDVGVPGGSEDEIGDLLSFAGRVGSYRKYRLRISGMLITK
jgi:HAMP domain-containing protein